MNYICACGLNEWGEKMPALLNCELLEMVKVKYGFVELWIVGNGKSEVWMLNMNWTNMWWVIIEMNIYIWIWNCEMWIDIWMMIDLGSLCEE